MWGSMVCKSLMAGNYFWKKCASCRENRRKALYGKKASILGAFRGIFERHCADGSKRKRDGKKENERI